MRAFGKALGMRKRNKEGLADYGERDPLDRPGKLAPPFPQECVSDSVDIRHLALRFVLPILGNPAFHMHGRSVMPGVYSHLASDPPMTIYRVLEGVWDAITSSTSGISRRISLVLLNESSIAFLLTLIGRQDIEPSTGRTIGEIVTSFLAGVTTNPGRGVCFADEGWYPRQAEEKVVDEDEFRGRDRRDDKERRELHNRILSNVVRKIGAKVVDEDGKLGEFVVRVLESCPELVAG